MIGWNAVIGYDGNMERYVKTNVGKCCREVYTIFLWSMFGLLGKKTISQKCIRFFCDPFLDFWVTTHFCEKKRIFQKCILFVVVHFWTFEPKAMFPEVYTIFLWSILGLLGKTSKNAESSKMSNFKKNVFTIEDVVWNPKFEMLEFFWGLYLV